MNGGENISFLVCHMEKYHKTDIVGVERENERDETYRADNPQIDVGRTRENYNIIKRQKSYTQFINDRIEELDLPTKVRKDAVLMCSFVVGSDRQFFGRLSPREQQQFFVDCTRFFAERYGEDNVISAVVHMDETTPHLHLNLIPVVDGRLSAKALFDRKALQSLQTDFHSAVGKKWGLQRGQEGSQAKHLSTAEFKAKKIVEQANGEADVLRATAERKVKIAQVHADDIVAEAQSQADRKLQTAQSRADELVAQAQSQADNAKAQAQEYLDGVIQSVESEKAKPIPKRRRQAEEEISLLRKENEALRQSKNISDRDRKDLFEQLQKAERAGKGKEAAYKMVSDMLDAYPNEFDVLLKKSRAKKSGTSPFKSHGFDRGGK